MRTLREMMDLIESAQTVAGTTTVSNKDLADLIHDITVDLIFNKQKMSINEADPKLVAIEVQKAYKMEGIPFTQNDSDRVSILFPRVMKKLRKGFSEESSLDNTD